MALRGSYRSIAARLGAAEHQAAGLQGPGCPTCADWRPNVVLYGDGTTTDNAPWYCRAAGCTGCVECHPRGGWPRTLRCPACGGAPPHVFRVTYVDDWPGRAA